MIKAQVPSYCLLPVASPVAGGGGGVSGAPCEALVIFSGPHLLALAPSQRPCPQQHHLWGSGLQYELWRHTDFQTITTRTPGRASSPGGRLSESWPPTAPSSAGSTPLGVWRSLWVVGPVVGVLDGGSGGTGRDAGASRRC